MDEALTRALWHRLETINAVAYFSDECREAPARRGLKGFWMGYFACRAAPLGPVGPGVVEAVFFNFHGQRVRRAIPDAWDIASPSDVLGLRSQAASTALRRLLPSGDAEALAGTVLPAARSAIERASSAGTPLFAANRDVPPPADPVASLWQAATTLREHRGDVHVALLTGAGWDGCEAHVMFAACVGVASQMYLQSRGWSADDWDEAVQRLRSRGLLASDGSPTDRGRSVRDEIERQTDQLAAQPYESLGDNGVRELIDALQPATERITAAGEIAYPNPMGLPEVGPN